MPIYKGSNEVTSGSLKKGSTNIENGYKETDQFYVNTNAIIINFVDAISGATMNTTQFSSTGTPGSSFTPFTRTITTDSGRIFQGTVTVAESGDTGGNVSASISGQGSTTATLNVSGTHPNTGVTVTLTVNGATQVQLPNLNVSIPSESSATFSTSDSSNLGTFNYTLTQSASGGGANPSCSGGTSPTSGTFTSNSSSYNYPGFSAGYAAGGSFGNGCGVTCTSSVSASKSGYNSGSNSYSHTGSNPGFVNTYQWSPSSNPDGARAGTASGSDTCGGVCPSCNNCTGTCSSVTLVAFLPSNLAASPGAACFGSVGAPATALVIGSVSNVNNGDTLTNAIPGKVTNYPLGAGASLGGSPSIGCGGACITGGNMTQNMTYPATNNIGMNYVGTATGANGAQQTCGGTAGNGYANSQTFNYTCSGSVITTPVTVVLTTYSNNLGGQGAGDFSTATGTFS